MSFESVCAAYGTRAAEYIEAVGGVDHVSEADRAHILAWARGVEGRVLDVGSGPGQWTDHLRRQGVAIEGVEPVPEFLAAARRRYPDSRYREGRAEDLPAPDRSLGGILAWYSLIHTEPDGIAAPLEEFARVLAPGGSLLLGFFTKVLIVFSISLLTFWTLNGVGLMWSQQAVLQVLSGTIVPVALLPGWLGLAAEILPMRGIVSTPLMLYLGKADGWQVVQLLTLQAGWLVVLWLGANWAWRRAFRALEAQGG